MNTAWWFALYVAAGILALNGFAGLIGRGLSEKYEWKYASDILRIIIGAVLAIIAALFLTFSN